MTQDVNPFQPEHVEDEPIAIVPGNNQSLLHPDTPKGVTFNKKLIMGFTGAISIIGMLAIVYAFSPPKKAVSANEAAAKSSQQEENAQMANTAALMPQEIAKLAESYENQKTDNSSVATASDTDVNDAFPGSSANPFFDASAPATGSAGTPVADNSGTPVISDGELARKSSIRFEKLQNLRQNQASNQAGSEGSGNLNPNYQAVVDQNKQSDKVAFLQTNQSSAFYSASRVEPARSKFEVKASTIIPAVLITGINSDLPGNISAQVRENVYDSTTGRYLLIPQGCRLVGLYDSKITYGQRRVMVVWTRLIFPNGSSLDLESIPGVDLSGYSGLSGKVNNHWGKLIAGGVITSLLSVGAHAATNDGNVLTNSTKEMVGASLAQNASDIGTKYVEKNLDVQPTIEIRPGTKFNVFVVKDFMLQPYLN